MEGRLPCTVHRPRNKSLLVFRLAEICLNSGTDFSNLLSTFGKKRKINTKLNKAPVFTLCFSQLALILQSENNAGLDPRLSIAKDVFMV